MIIEIFNLGIKFRCINLFIEW